MDSANNRIPFGVTIMPVIKKEKGTPAISEYTPHAQRVAQYYFESRGYYTELATAGDIKLLSNIKLAPKHDIEAIGCKNSQYIFVITIEVSDKTDALILKTEGVGGEMMLIDGTTAATVWKQGWWGVATSGWITRAFLDEYQEAMQAGLVGSLKKLPPYGGIIEVK